MATERKPLYITIPSVHQFELPTTASAGAVIEGTSTTYSKVFC